MSRLTVIVDHRVDRMLAESWYERLERNPEPALLGAVTSRWVLRLTPDECIELLRAHPDLALSTEPDDALGAGLHVHERTPWRE